MKKRKPGINEDIVCRKCGHKVGRVTLKRKLQWRQIRWMIGLALTFEILANIVVYIMFESWR